MKPKDKKMMILSFTDGQMEALEELATKMNCADVPTLFDKCLELALYFAETEALKDKEILVINRSETKRIKSGDNKDKRTVMVFDRPSSCIKLTTEIEERMNLRKKIAATNAFNYPLEPYKA